MADMYRVRTTFTGTSGSPWYSNLYFLVSGGLTAQQATDAVGSFWGTIDSFMVDDVAWVTDGDVPIVDSVSGQTTGVYAVTPAGGSGAQSTEAVPWSSQALVRWLTSAWVAGRQVRGRTFIPALYITAVDDGKVLGGTRTAILGAANTLRTGTGLCVWSRTHSQAYLVGAAAVWDQWAVLTSRRD